MSEVLYQVVDGVAVVTINRPERHNTMNTALRDALFEVWRGFEADEAARVAILTAAGDTAFCAGRDLKDPVQAAMTEVKRGYLPVSRRDDQGLQVRDRRDQRSSPRARLHIRADVTCA